MLVHEDESLVAETLRREAKEEETMNAIQSEDIKELVTALSKAQAEIKPAKKDTENKYFQSFYADLAAVLTACMPHLTANGLSIVQTMQTTGQDITLVTTLYHSSGQWIRSFVPVKPEKFTPQGIGSALTYMRRYSAAAIAGVAQEDDDGNAGSGKDSARKTDLKDTKAFDSDLDRVQQEEIHRQAIANLSGAASMDALTKIWMPLAKTLKKLDDDLRGDLIAKKDEVKAELQKQQDAPPAMGG